MLESDESGLTLVLERASPQTLADLVATHDCSVEEAIEVAGELARRLAVLPLPSIRPLTDTMSDWEDQLDLQIAVHPDALPGWALDQARETIQHLAADKTPTMLHGDLHYGNILRSHREPWLTIDPKGWFGTAAFDAFTVAAGGREQLSIGDGLNAAIGRRVGRYATAARVNLDLALACCQARAASSYFYQLRIPSVWFDAEFSKMIALGSHGR